jgi:Ras-related protein Rab-18
VYDVSNRDTFNALTTWWDELSTYCPSKDVVNMIIGNKVDKVSDIVYIENSVLIHHRFLKTNRNRPES